MKNISTSAAVPLSSFMSIRRGLVVSCQVPDGTPIDTPEFLAAQAQTVVQAGAAGIRAQGISNVTAVVKAVGVPVIGLVKHYSNDIRIHITPSVEDVIQLAEAGASIVAIDATGRNRSEGLKLEKFISQVRAQTNVPLLADVDTVEAGVIAESLGCEAVATTLSGYTEKPAPALPNLKLVADLAGRVNIPVIAEGGFSTPKELAQAFDAGAWSVCIGTAITNPFLLTKKFTQVLS